MPLLIVSDTHTSAMAFTYFEKTLKHFWCEDCQFSYMDVMLRGSFTGPSVRPIQPP